MIRGSSRRDYRSGGGTLDAHGLGDRPEEAQTSRTELSGRRVLTQEFVVGVKISEVTRCATPVLTWLRSGRPPSAR